MYNSGDRKRNRSQYVLPGCGRSIAARRATTAPDIAVVEHSFSPMTGARRCLWQRVNNAASRKILSAGEYFDSCTAYQARILLDSVMLVAGLRSLTCSGRVLYVVDAVVGRHSFQSAHPASSGRHHNEFRVYVIGQRSEKRKEREQKAELINAGPSSKAHHHFYGTIKSRLVSFFMVPLDSATTYYVGYILGELAKKVSRCGFL